jgi:hypothetical protein
MIMNRSHIKAYVTAINSAALNRRTALQTELAVGFAVILESGPSKRLARAQIVEIYAEAGYKCRETSDLDYKTINRRISASFALYDFLGEKDIREWTKDLTRGPLLQAIIEHLIPLKLTTINEVLQICQDTKTEPSTRGRKPGIHIDTEHLHLVISRQATYEEILEAAAKLMQLAQDMMQEKNIPMHTEEEALA